MAKKDGGLFVHRNAIFSPCRLYRYALDIRWGTGKNVVFIGLNPSTADEYQDDPTIRRLRGFAEAWDMGGMRMLNLFAYRATDPKVMKAYSEPVGPENDLVRLVAEVSDVALTVGCWGIHGPHRGRSDEVMRMLKGLRCFGLTENAQPKHPLYLKADTKLEML